MWASETRKSGLLLSFGGESFYENQCGFTDNTDGSRKTAMIPVIVTAFGNVL